jgi:8-oxo-dGTP pyrophosphatase MutT (NUDIX family)
MTGDIAFLETVKNSILPISASQNLKVEGLRPAAVLMPLVLEEGKWKLLFIRRSDIGEFHRGEVAFPGGGMEFSDDDLVKTALRETSEELGIAEQHIRVLGFLPSLSTVSNYLVTPIVGYLDWPIKLRLEKQEVVKVFTIPSQWLSDHENWKNREIDIPGRGMITAVVYKEYKGETLWGLSARMTLDLMDRIQ